MSRTSSCVVCAAIDEGAGSVSLVGQMSESPENDPTPREPSAYAGAQPSRALFFIIFRVFQGRGLRVRVPPLLNKDRMLSR